jgi:hypothetical protein
MANYRSANVIVVDTSAAFLEAIKIKAVKYIGDTGASADIRAQASNGAVLWEETSDNTVFNEVNISDSKGVYVTVANGAKVYLYLA